MKESIFMLYLFILILPNIFVNGTSSSLTVKEPLLFISTLGGNMYAINQNNGIIQWKLSEDPVLKLPSDLPKGTIFLPNPVDGSLYAFNDQANDLRKLPFTIPELVTTSPCRSTDGILYTGYKRDSWFAIDPITGSKLQTLAMHSSDEICPSGSSMLYIGRTEYTVTMFDGKSRSRLWNVTFMDYSSHAKVDLIEYTLRHFASSEDGILVTMDGATGNVLWTKKFDDPVIGVYVLNHDSIGLVKVPIATVAVETLEHITGRLVSDSWKERFLNVDDSFSPSLYVGEYDKSFYALPTMVDDSISIIRVKDRGPLLIDGPNKQGKNSQFITTTNLETKLKVNLLLGHYQNPLLANWKISSRKLINNNSIINITPVNDTKNERPQNEVANSNFYIWITIIFGFGIMFFMLCYVAIVIPQATIKKLEDSRNDSSSNNIAIIQQQQQQTQTSLGKPESTSFLFDENPDSDGFTTVGKIKYNESIRLGDGCQGTFVYKGKFDNRDVAVKRLLNEYYAFASHEVKLLREFDLHPNVVRYYWMESDSRFHYIALELCLATLKDYIDGKIDKSHVFNKKKLLEEATCGLAHLHSLDIVHLDIKPQNVLITMPDAHHHCKAVISDFGLCKKLKPGHASFTKKSGTTGTIGWTAPELLNDSSKKPTKTVDIFSLGCVYYYILSAGRHPFGEVMKRQANIINNKYEWGFLKTVKDSPSCLAKDIIKKMISNKSCERPTCKKILKHPIFWNAKQQLDFFQDVSDRIEKESCDDIVILMLESRRNKIFTHCKDWREVLTDDLQEDLRRFRTYKGNSVRDLLRAIRNKKHHYRELPQGLQNSLGEIPEQYIKYFTSRFPNLLLQTYEAMACCGDESTLMHYYDQDSVKEEIIRENSTKIQSSDVQPLPLFPLNQQKGFKSKKKLKK